MRVIVVPGIFSSIWRKIVNPEINFLQILETIFIDIEHVIIILAISSMCKNY